MVTLQQLKCTDPNNKVVSFVWNGGRFEILFNALHPNTVWEYEHNGDRHFALMSTDIDELLFFSADLMREGSRAREAFGISHTQRRQADRDRAGLLIVLGWSVKHDCPEVRTLFGAQPIRSSKTP